MPSLSRVRSLLLATTVFASPVLADAPPEGKVSFAGGRGHITFETGAVDMSVTPLRATGEIVVDDAPVAFAEGLDSIDGRTYGGDIVFVLPGEDEMSWFGRNLRLFGGYERQKADAAEDVRAPGPTITERFAVTSVSSDGRAFARSISHAAFAVAQVGFFSPMPTAGSSCSVSNGGNTGSGFHDAGAAGTLTCNADANTAESLLTFNPGGQAWGATAFASVLPGGDIATETAVISSYSVSVRRGEAGFAGDYEITPAITASPSLSISIGSRRAQFFQLEAIADDFSNSTIAAQGFLDGSLDTRDAALNLGLRAGYALGSGFDVFGSLGGAAVRRKTTMRASTIVGSIVLGDDTVAVFSDSSGPGKVRRDDTIAAFQGMLELGAGYTFDPAIGIGPLRLSATAGLTYDSDVPTYGNAGTLGDFDVPVTEPVAPAHIAYNDETTLTFKAAIAVELP